MATTKTICKPLGMEEKTETSWMPPALKEEAP
jgi:hypothetical protein